MPSAYYRSTIARFVREEPRAVLGQLTAGAGGAIDAEQIGAWTSEIDVLAASLNDIPGEVFLEFTVPRIGSRIDAVVITGAAVVVIEFKVGATRYNRADYNQAWDYALDLKNFHAASHEAPIVPVLVATEAHESSTSLTDRAHDGVHTPIKCNAADLAAVLREVVRLHPLPRLDPVAWAASPYRPTPTILEAARALYYEHSVDAIARMDAGARNLALTSKAVESIAASMRSKGAKAIVFVTGVPGAGKTLVGLNVATHKRDRSDAGHAVFLSGNGPLVEVLSTALARDEHGRQRRLGNTEYRMGDAQLKVKSFIHHILHFRDAGLASDQPPFEHVVIFDEAQRAWTKEKLALFMKTRRGRAGFTRSEPEVLMEYMDRHQPWAVVVCLVGGGQEINTGEAGISGWLDAVRDHFPSWRVFISSELRDSEYAAGEALARLGSGIECVTDPDLHLAVSMRSFRAENVSGFVKAVLDHDLGKAQSVLRLVLPKYPLVLTRNLQKAKAWVRTKARGSERYGLVACSSAERLKPHAIDVRVKVNPVQWFLNDADHTRSSYYLEDAASEFDVQGLEVDWVCMTWDADLRHVNGTWAHHEFRGDGWNNVLAEHRQKYLVNAYRVLLTRARQGMVIFVPPGDADDHTRPPEYYDQTFEYLKSTGIPVLS